MYSYVKKWGKRNIVSSSVVVLDPCLDVLSGQPNCLLIVHILWWCLSNVFISCFPPVLEFMTRNTNNISWRHRDKWHQPIDGLMLATSLWSCRPLIGWQPLSRPLIGRHADPMLGRVLVRYAGSRAHWHQHLHQALTLPGPGPGAAEEAFN